MILNDACKIDDKDEKFVKKSLKIRVFIKKTKKMVNCKSKI